MKKDSLYFNVGDSHIAVSDNNEGIVSFSTFKDRDDYTKVEHITVGNTNLDIAKWGHDNNLPEFREQLICDNNIVGELIATKRDLCLGKDIITYIENFSNGKMVRERIEIPDVIQDFLDENIWENFALCSAGEYFKHGNIFTQMVQKKGSTAIARIYNKRCKHIRAGVQNKSGFVDNYYWHGSWGTQRKGGAEKVKKSKPKTVPAFIRGKYQGTSILHVGDKLFFDGYYYTPTYWGGKEWITTSNNIPKFHQSALENGYNITFHIEYPFDYFRDPKVWSKASDEKELEKCEDQERKAKQNFIDDMNKFLAGVKNGGRAVYTSFKYEYEKVYPGIKITPIKYDMKDEALLKLYEKSNDANISSQGISPSIAGIQTQGKLSSGSDIRNAQLLYLTVKAPNARRLVLTPLRIVQKLNGWDPKIKFDFEDSFLTTLDKEPSGVTKPTEDED